MIGIKKEFIRWLNSVKPAGKLPLSEDANIGAIMGFILFIIVAIIGVVIMSNVNKVVTPMVNTTTAGGMLKDATGYGYNTTMANVWSNAVSGTDLLMVSVIVIAAAIIIGVLLTSFMRRQT